ncbi:thiolase family protein [uncultured Zhongshania sp.]|jgi:acetyl-CoA acetyltransferase|uniref:thiolase family protein n=1 Tax=uncultured Zhongshania sp. TaxID=1642288 RepID=UPI0025E44ABD|nr:thiolase family protein [uncultured Zhongshania sp.]
MGSVQVVGAGIHKFGRSDGVSGLQMGIAAVRSSLVDAGIDWSDVQFVYGGSADCGAIDSILPVLGYTGIPTINVANGCATGGSSLVSAVAAIQSGEYELGVVLGFDKHARGAFNAKPESFGLPQWYGQAGFMLTTQFFAMKIKRYMWEYGIDEESLARVAEKSFTNGALTEHAWRRTPVGLDEIMSSPMVSDPLRKYMFCSPSEGAVALVVASEKYVKEKGLSGPRIKGVSIKSRLKGSFEVFSPSMPFDRDVSPTVLAAQDVFEKASVSPRDISIAQLQDTESGAEIMHMAENGFCEDGEQSAMLKNGDTGLGGRLPINTDGGCIACGEPIAASGLRQVYENYTQLKGRAGKRQVEGVRLAYSHVYGAPGVSAVSILEK